MNRVPLSDLKMVFKNPGDGVPLCTLPKTNIAPENRPSQKESSIPTINFQGLC